MASDESGKPRKGKRNKRSRTNPKQDVVAPPSDVGDAPADAAAPDAAVPDAAAPEASEPVAASAPQPLSPQPPELPELPASEEPAAGQAGSWRISQSELPARSSDSGKLAAGDSARIADADLPSRPSDRGKLTADEARALVARVSGKTTVPPVNVPADPSAASSGSVDVQFSGNRIPAASESGSVEVAMSSSGVPQSVGDLDSQPVAGSGGVPAVVPPHEGSGPVRGQRAKRVTNAVQEAVSSGVEVLGAGIGVVGEGVAKLGDLTNKVPIVGESVARLGEGITKAGESIHALPRVAQTRRGRLLVRSVLVGFSLVFTWITAIVWFQLKTHDTPDFRPQAEALLTQMGKGPAAIADVYEHASPRFHEIVKKERFIDDMTDMFATNGKFREISAISETLVTTGPTGRVGRVGLTASFERGVANGSISFHWDEGRWKLLGIGIEVPDKVTITQTERQKRVAACIDDKGHDVSDQRAKCDVREAAETILEKIRDGHAGDVWDAANDIFKQQESRLRFTQIQDEQHGALGNYKRILSVTDARAIAGVSASFDVLAEYEKSSGVRVEFDFTRPSKTERWRLARFKVTVPMPRPFESPEATAPPVPNDAGVPATRGG